MSVLKSIVHCECMFMCLFLCVSLSLEKLIHTYLRAYVPVHYNGMFITTIKLISKAFKRPLAQEQPTLSHSFWEVEGSGSG